MRKILIGLLLTCVGWTTPALAKETIKIGAILGVTGPVANLGGPEARTLEMLVQEINKKGGIKGNPVELIVKDSSASPEKAISFAKQLIDKHGGQIGLVPSPLGGAGGGTRGGGD